MSNVCTVRVAGFEPQGTSGELRDQPQLEAHCGSDEERPFSRDQRRWIYASSKKQNNYIGFGTESDLEMSTNYLIGVRQELLQLSRACGKPHPSLVTLDQFEILDENFEGRSGTECFGYAPLPTRE